MERGRRIDGRLFKPLLVAILLAAATVAAYGEAVDIVSKRVLVLYSYNYNLPAQQDVANGIQEIISSAGLRFGDFLQEYLDITPPRYRGQEADLAAVLLRKYGDLRFDLIITVYDAALDFILADGRGISPGTPCLSALAAERQGLESAGRRIIQIPVRYDIKGTLELALELFPATAKVVFVAGKAKPNIALERQARVDFAPWRGRLDFEYAGDLPMDGLLRRVGSLPRGSVVIYSAVSSDAAGTFFLPKDVAASLAKAANAPVFSLVSSQLDTGVIGGSMLDMKALGSALGRAVLALERGEAPSTGETSAYVRPMFSWPQLGRWGASAARLPAGSVFVDRPSSFWAQYRPAVIVTGCGFGFLLALVAALTLANRRRKAAEGMLKASLAEKEVLLRELYHRTKNNMSVIMAMLGLQSGRTEDERLRGALAEAQDRIHSMALVHEKLYEAQDLSHINLGEYIGDLIRLLVSSHDIAPGRIEFSLSMDEVYVLIDTAVPCGLIVNELMTNAMKHAFPGERSGRIDVELRRGESGEIGISVKDDGVGPPAGFDLRRDGSVGLQTIFALGEQQLDARVEFDAKDGFACSLRFKDEFYEPRV